MKQVSFSEIPVGGWFKPTNDGCWHLKNTATTGAYQQWGTRYEPRFKADELVFVD